MDNKEFAEQYASAIKEFISENQGRKLTRDVMPDVLSDTLFEFLKEAQKVRIDKPLYWLRSSARILSLHHCSKQAESERKFERLAPGLFCHSEQAAEASDSTFEHEVVQVDRLSASRIWNRLSPMRKELLQLHKIDGVSVPRAAKQINCPLTTAKSWLQRDMKKLRQDPVLREIAGVSPGYSMGESNHDQ